MVCCRVALAEISKRKQEGCSYIVRFVSGRPVRISAWMTKA